MNIGILIAIVGAAAWIPGIYGVIDAVRRHKERAHKAVDEGDRLVVKSAIELLDPYAKRVKELEDKLASSETTATSLKTQLETANRRASNLNERLSDAQTELGFLRVQVRIMSQQLKPEA